MIEEIGTVLLILLGLASTFALYLGWSRGDTSEFLARRSIAVEHGDLIASEVKRAGSGNGK
jgi:hypothetical protein